MGDTVKGDKGTRGNLSRQTLRVLEAKDGYLAPPKSADIGDLESIVDKFPLRRCPPAINLNNLPCHIAACSKEKCCISHLITVTCTVERNFG
jgi:hypothetical protein